MTIQGVETRTQFKTNEPIETPNKANEPIELLNKEHEPNRIKNIRTRHIRN